MALCRVCRVSGVSLRSSGGVPVRGVPLRAMTRCAVNGRPVRRGVAGAGRSRVRDGTRGDDATDVLPVGIGKADGA